MFQIQVEISFTVLLAVHHKMAAVGPIGQRRSLRLHPLTRDHGGGGVCVKLGNMEMIVSEGCKAADT